MNEETQMTRQQMQDEALVIETLLDAAQALFGTDSDEETLRMIEMACTRANKLHSALDSVNAPKAMA
ncbi:MAG: hypothetical protein AAGA74_20510 [Pseudomonadota bacterium]